MSYDFTGSWTETSGHHAQLYCTPGAGEASTHTGVDYILSKQVPPHKILLGIPIYGRSFLGAGGPGQRYSGCGGEEGTFEYKDLPRPGTHEQVDETLVAAYCAGADGGFVTYDNPQTVQMKARYAKSRGLAGLFYWSSLGDATGDRSLVLHGYNALHSTN